MGRRIQRQMLGTRVSLRTDHLAFADYVDRLYAEFPRCRGADLRYVVEQQGADRFALSCNGEHIASDHVESLVGTFVNHCNRAVVEAAPHVLVHAGAVERDGVAVILPATMESGKTTLTTGLVRAGFRYLTDEAVAFDRSTGILEPYPKPMSIDPGSWQLFGELEPDEPFATDGYKKNQWQVPPAAIRADAIGQPSRARLVVFPRFERGQKTRLEPIRRAEATVELAKNTFGFNREPRASLEVLAEMVQHTDTYRLPNGNLGAAVEAITELFDTLD